MKLENIYSTIKQIFFYTTSSNLKRVPSKVILLYNLTNNQHYAMVHVYQQVCQEVTLGLDQTSPHPPVSKNEYSETCGGDLRILNVFSHILRIILL